MPRLPFHALRPFAVRRRLLIAIATTMAVCRSRRADAAPPAGSRGPAPLVLIAIFDGLRPDIVSPQHTPNIARLKKEGVHYGRSHAAFPTVTRVNGGTLVTGMWPERHGLVSNTMYVPAVDPAKPFSTGEWKELVKLRDATAAAWSSRRRSANTCRRAASPTWPRVPGRPEAPSC